MIFKEKLSLNLKQISAGDGLSLPLLTVIFLESFYKADNSQNKMGTSKGQLLKKGAVLRISPDYC